MSKKWDTESTFLLCFKFPFLILTWIKCYTSLPLVRKRNWHLVFLYTGKRTPEQKIMIQILKFLCILFAVFDVRVQKKKKEYKYVRERNLFLRQLKNEYFNTDFCSKDVKWAFFKSSIVTFVFYS